MLQALLAPLTVAEFVAGFVGQRAHHAAMPAETLRSLAALPALQSAASLAALPAKGTCLSFRPENWLPRVTELPPDEALAEYEAGCSFYAGRVEQGVPELARLCRGVADALGVPRLCVSAQAFASRAGHGLDLHFDHDDNFSLQLTGRKMWRAGRNDLVPHAFKSGFWGRSLFRELGLEEGREPPAPVLETFEAPPGSLVYVPRGFWHATRCLEDSLSISIAVRPPYAFQVVLAAVQRRLLEEPSGRVFAMGVTKPGLPQNGEFRDALAPLLRALSTLRPEDCTELHEAPSPLAGPSLKGGCFQPGPRAAVGGAPVDLATLRVPLADGTLAPLVVPPRWAAVVAGLLELEVFVLDDALARSHSVSTAQLERLVDEMLAKELVERLG